MVGRLIEDQKIGFREHQFCKGNPSAFSTAQVTDPFKHIIPGKKKCGKDIADLRII